MVPVQLECHGTSIRLISAFPPFPHYAIFCSRPSRLSLFTKTLIIAFRCNEESDGGDCSHICMHCHDKEKCHYQCVPGPGYMLWAYQGTVGGAPAPGCCESVALTTMACAMPCY